MFLHLAPKPKIDLVLKVSKLTQGRHLNNLGSTYVFDATYRKNSMYWDR